jgi:hypothetical protein
MIKGKFKQTVDIMKKFHEIKNSDSNLTDKEALKIAIQSIQAQLE